MLQQFNGMVRYVVGHAALEEKERAVISQRTKAAGRRKGLWAGSRQSPAGRGRAIGNAHQKTEADAHADVVMPVIREAQAGGLDFFISNQQSICALHRLSNRWPNLGPSEGDFRR